MGARVTVGWVPRPVDRIHRHRTAPVTLGLRDRYNKTTDGLTLTYVRRGEGEGTIPVGPQKRSYFLILSLF